MESRRYGTLRTDTECEEPRCAEGPARALECLGGRRTAGPVIGWALAIPMCVSWVVHRLGIVPGIPPSRYPTRYTHPPVHPSPHARTAVVTALTAVSGLTKEILGVDNAHQKRVWGRSQYPRAPTLSARSSLLPCSRLSGPCTGSSIQYPVSSIQYLVS